MKTPMQNTVLTAEKIDYNGANIAKRFSGHNVMAQRPNNKEVEAVDLSIYYGNTPAVNKVTLPFYKNCITAIIGPSGCGKSTLIKSINRVCEISSKMKVEGEILFKGKNVYDRDVDVVELRRRIGMVFQKPNPFQADIVVSTQIVPGLDDFPGVVRLDDGLVLIHDLERFLSLEEARALDEAMDERPGGS